MSLFTAALGGAGESMQGMARTYMREEVALNLQQQAAELDKSKAQMLADLQQRNQRARDDYLVSDDYASRAAKAAGTVKRAESENTAYTLAPGMQRHLGDEYIENERPTSQEVQQSLYEQGLKATGAGRTGPGGAGPAGKAPKPEAEGIDLKHVKAARDILKGSPLEEQLAANSAASTMFDQLVTLNRNMTPAQAAQLALEASSSNDPKAAEANPKAAKRTNSIMFDASGRPMLLPTITDGEGNEYYLGGARQKPASKNDVATYLNDVLVPRAAVSGPTKDLADKVDNAIRFLKIEPAEFQTLVDEFRAKQRSESDLRRETKPERRAARQPAVPPIPAESRTRATAPIYEGGMFLDDAT